MSKETQNKDVDFAERAVPAENRKGMLTMFMIMLGFTFFSASMWVGQELAEGLDFWASTQVFWAMSEPKQACPWTFCRSVPLASRALTCPLP